MSASAKDRGEKERNSGLTAPAPRPRDRILAAAADLFYRHGIRAVGVEAIAEAAGTNKMTLYRHFASKDHLVAEYLRQVGQEADAEWDEGAKAFVGNPKGEIRAWLEAMASCVSSGGEGGCAFANAAVELKDKDHPARIVIEEVKTRHRNRLVRLFRDAGLREPENLADEIFLLIEGARINIQSVGPDGPGSRLVGMIQAMIDSHAQPQDGSVAANG
jgi:AcrR family transcriptional regulator